MSDTQTRGHYTFGLKEAADFAATFKRIGTVVPMHYQGKPEMLEEFEGLAKEGGIEIEIFEAEK